MEGAELEDVADLDRRLHAERAPALRARVAVLGLADVGEGRLVVAARLDAPEMLPVLVRAGDVLAVVQRLVGDHLHVDADGPERASTRPEGCADLVVRSGTECRLEQGLELLGAELVVSAYEREHEAVAGHDRERLRGGGLRDPEQVRDVLDRGHARRVDGLGRIERRRQVGRRRRAARSLGVGEVVAVLAAHQLVLARAGRSEEAERALAAHDPGLRLDEVRLEPTALEDPGVRLLVPAEGRVEPGLVGVERVRVLHDELAEAQEAAARARLVPVLGREVVPDLRQLLVGLDLAREERHRLLVRPREHERPAAAVVEVEEDRDIDAAGRLPELCGRERRSAHLLAADRVDLLADDLLDPHVHAPAERQHRPQAGPDLADEAAAHEQLVRRSLRVGGRVAQGREEEL